MPSATSMAVTESNGSLHTLEQETVSPAGRRVRVDVAACGVCHADIATATAGDRASFPVVPGHAAAHHRDSGIPRYVYGCGQRRGSRGTMGLSDDVTPDKNMLRLRAAVLTSTRAWFGRWLS